MSTFLFLHTELRLDFGLSSVIRQDREHSCKEGVCELSKLPPLTSLTCSYEKVGALTLPLVATMPISPGYFISGLGWYCAPSTEQLG